MDRPLHQHLPADPVVKPTPVRAEQDPWGLAETPDAAGPDVSLAELTRSNVAVNVLEAVAIVREICWLSNDPPAVMFDLETVALRASGDVVGKPTPAPDPAAAVQSVAKVFQALISRTLVPPKLQELVAAATVDSERYPSFAEFADAFRSYQSPNGRELIRGVYLRWRSGATPSSARVLASDLSKRLKTVARVWASVQSRIPSDRRVVAGLGLLVVAGASLIALTRYDFSRSTETASDTTNVSSTTDVSSTTENTSVGPVASALNTALSWIGMGPASPDKSADAVPVPEKRVSKSRPTAATSRSGNSSRAGQPTPLGGAATGQANALPLDATAINATVETPSEEALARAQDDPAGETSLVYSADDTEVTPPVAVRSPGIVTDRSNKDQNISLIDILVNETGHVESVLGRPRPATLGATLQSTTALSVVKTWRFRPARKNGQPVKYRTTVPFIETVYGAGRD